MALRYIELKCLKRVRRNKIKNSNSEVFVVTDCIDHATGWMIENEKGGGQFKEVTLKPIVTVADSAMKDKAIELHHKADEVCYIDNVFRIRLAGLIKN